MGTINGLREIGEELGKASLSEFLGKVDIIVHGTTITTNAVLTENLSKPALLPLRLYELFK